MMKDGMNDGFAAALEGFHLPRYHEIPDVGLYLEQVTGYLSAQLGPLQSVSITSSMISNYVKKDLIANPVKKQYNREQIAYLFFIAVAKSVLTLEEISWVIRLQKLSYEPERAYEYFCLELQNVLQYVFGLKDQLDSIGQTKTEEKSILQNIIIAVAHKAYLNKCLAALQKIEKEKETI